MKVKNTLIALFTGAGLVIFFGCEGDWTTGGGVESWNDSYNWVNFSGVYRGIDGGILVTDYKMTPSESGATNVFVVKDQVLAVGNNGSMYAGNVGRKNIVPGSFIVVAGGFTLTDNGTGGLVGNASTTGTIVYATGAWSIDLKGNIVNSGVAILGSYSYSVSHEGSVGGAVSGVSGPAIYAFTVHQTGQHLTITDNNGASYMGNIGSLSATSGALPAPGESVIAQYTAEGTSAAGVRVTLAGTLQGVVSADALINRVILGTWIEHPGRTGNINGEAAPAPILTTETTTAPATP